MVSIRLTSSRRVILIALAFAATFGGDHRLVSAQPIVGNCDESTAESMLDIGNVRARIFANGKLFNNNTWAAKPEVGTVFRIVAVKAFQPGDVFAFSTAGLAPAPRSLSEQVARLDNIAIVPNPDRGISQYEAANLKDEVRFTKPARRSDEVSADIELATDS